MSLMQNTEYKFIDTSLVPQEFIEEYNQQYLIRNNKLYIQIS